MTMRKILQPCMCNVYKGTARGFVHVEYENECLSITGVIGPMSNGNCKGSAGQCTDDIRQGTPAAGWTREMLDKLCDIWDRWHLNDMRPYCEHQKALGWDQLARKEVTLYHYRLTRETNSKVRQAKRQAVDALRDGNTFTPTPEQTKLANLPYALVLPEPVSGELAEFYEPKRPLWAGDQGPTEIKALGWLREDEHPQGILGKACPVCGYRYGHAWLKEKVPDDVIEWLSNLPDTPVQPAWI